MTKPSLSADLAASLQATTATISSLFRSLKELSYTVDVESNMKAARLDALEKKTNGLIQTRADYGHQFIVIIDRVKALEERVAALEGHVEMIADSYLVADQHYELRERVAALEQVHTERLDMHVRRLLALEEACMLLSAMFHDGDCSEDECPKEPLPEEDLD